MTSSREIKLRLRGAQKTRQITRAMKMVATVRLRHAQAALAAGRPYAEHMSALAAGLLSRIEAPEDNHFLKRRPVRKILFVVVVSDRGLCGNLNANVFRQASQFAGELRAWGSGFPTPEKNLLPIGRKARDFFKMQQAIHPEGLLFHIRDAINFSAVDAASLSRQFCESYRREEVDRIDLFYNESAGTLQHRPAHLQLFPLDLAKLRAVAGERFTDMIFEPDCAEMVDEVVGAYVFSLVRRIMLEAEVAEHAARMVMMDLATKNADELISTMRLAMNKIRQLSITNELADITTGAEALI